MENITLTIKGMTCQMCVKHVTKALAGLESVSNVQVNLDAGIATLVYDPGKVGMAEFKTAVADAGYEVMD